MTSMSNYKLEVGEAFPTFEQEIPLVGPFQLKCPTSEFK